MTRARTRRLAAVAAVVWAWAGPLAAQGPAVIPASRGEGDGSAPRAPEVRSDVAPIVPGSGTARDTVPLTLFSALQMAENSSETVQVAAAGVKRLKGQEWQARSQLLPHLSANLGYTRTLATEFSSLQSTPDTTTGPTRPADCADYFEPAPGLSTEARLDSLEKAVQCATTANPFSAFRNLPFGRLNQYTLGLQGSMTLWDGGQLWAGLSAASAAREQAEVALNAQKAQVALDVAQAYYDALLSDRLLSISQQSLEQARTTLSQTRLATQVGQKPEFELLRAQVSAKNLEPTVIQRRSQRDLAHLRLKQLLDIPLDAPMDLVSPLGDSMPSLPGSVAKLAGLPPVDADTLAESRAPVKQAAQTVTIQKARLRAANRERLPTLQVSSQYSRVAYPNAGLPNWNEFRTNWTVGVSVQLPIFSGGRIVGDQMIAQANLDEAQARLKQTRELAQLDTRSARDALESARATWEASAQTVEQATKAYQIAEIRFSEGISTQLELADSRLMLSQAEANRAAAARDLQVARARIALLPYLPLGGTGASSGQSGGSVAGQGQTGSQAGAGSSGTSATSTGTQTNGTGADR